MENLERFLMSHCRWFVLKNKILSIEKESVNLSDEFIELFPTATRLIHMSDISKIQTVNGAFLLLSWEKQNDSSQCGWLIQLPEEKFTADEKIIPHHKLVCENIGSIVTTVNSDSNFLSNSSSHIFDCSRSFEGIGELWREYYIGLCLEYNFEPILDRDYITFSIEAGGHHTLYHKYTHQIIVFNTDPGYDWLQPIPNQPPSTFFQIKMCSTFRDYVEILAKQWLDIITPTVNTPLRNKQW